MLTTQQQKVININAISAKQSEAGGYIYLIAGKYVNQTSSNTEEGALKKGIGYIMSKHRK